MTKIMKFKKEKDEYGWFGCGMLSLQISIVIGLIILFCCLK